MPSREEIVHEISSIANWCEDQAASSALNDLAQQGVNMCCENCDSKDELLKEMAEALDKAVRAVSELIGYSRGVDGLHLNGDIAEWDSLRTGGNYEGWLIEFDEAASFLQKYHEQEETNAE